MSDRFLAFPLLHLPGGGSSFFNQLVGLGIRVFQDLLASRLCAGELLFDLVGVLHTLSNPLPALFEHRQDGLIGKLFQHEGDNEERDQLRNKEFRVDAEASGDLADNIPTFRLSGCRKENKLIHAESKTGQAAKAARPIPNRGSNNP